MRPFKFIRYFLINSGVLADFFESHPHSQGLKNFLVEFQKRYNAYSFVFNKDVYALYLNTYQDDLHQVDFDYVYKKYSETTYLGQSFITRRMKVINNNKEHCSFFIDQFNTYGSLMAKLQYMAAQLDTDHYKFSVQYLIKGNHVALFLACEDIIVDNSPMFEGMKQLKEIPSGLLGDILFDTSPIEDLREYIMYKHIDYVPQNDWSLLSFIETLQQELATNSLLSKIQVTELENKIETLLSICRRLGLPNRDSL